MPRLPLLAVALILVMPLAARAQGAGAPAPDNTGVPTDHWVPQHFDDSGRYVPGHYEQRKKPKFMGYFAPGETKPGQRGYPLPAPSYGPATPDADQQ